MLHVSNRCCSFEKEKVNAMNRSRPQKTWYFFERNILKLQMVLEKIKYLSAGKRDPFYRNELALLTAEKTRCEMGNVFT